MDLFFTIIFLATTVWIPYLFFNNITDRGKTKNYVGSVKKARGKK